MSEFLIQLQEKLGLRRESFSHWSRDRILGYTFILAVATIWVIASFAVQGIEQAGVHPAVLTYIANSLFALYLPIYWLNLRIKGWHSYSAAPQNGTAVNHHSNTLEEAHSLVPESQLRSDGTIAQATIQETSTHQLFRAAALVAPLWFLAQLTFNASLELTSVTSNTILSSASALFTFIFSVFILSERFTYIKLASIVAIMAGTAMVTLADAGTGLENKGTVIGDLLCLVSAVVYGGYTVAIRKMLGEDEVVAMTLFFGFMGGLIFFGVGPILGLAKLAGGSLGTMTWESFGLVVAKGLLDNVLSDYLWARAILLIGPTIATSGLSLQVPIAIGIDALVRNPRWMHSLGTALLTFLGGGVILIGFFVLTASSPPAEEDREDGGRSGGIVDEEQLERVWQRQSAALEAELVVSDLELEEEDGVMNGAQQVQQQEQQRYGVGRSGIPQHMPLHHRSVSPRGSGGAGGGQRLASLPPESKFSLD